MSPASMAMGRRLRLRPGARNHCCSSALTEHSVRVEQRVEQRFAARVGNDDDAAHAAVAKIVDGVVNTLLAIDIDDEQARARGPHGNAANIQPPSKAPMPPRMMSPRRP